MVAVDAGEAADHGAVGAEPAGTVAGVAGAEAAVQVVVLDAVCADEQGRAVQTGRLALEAGGLIVVVELWAVEGAGVGVGGCSLQQVEAALASLAGRRVLALHAVAQAGPAGPVAGHLVVEVGAGAHTNPIQQVAPICTLQALAWIGAEAAQAAIGAQQAGLICAVIEIARPTWARAQRQDPICGTVANSTGSS